MRKAWRFSRYPPDKRGGRGPRYAGSPAPTSVPPRGWLCLYCTALARCLLCGRGRIGTRGMHARSVSAGAGSHDTRDHRPLLPFPLGGGFACIVPRWPGAYFVDEGELVPGRHGTERPSSTRENVDGGFSVPRRCGRELLGATGCGRELLGAMARKERRENKRGARAKRAPLGITLCGV